eukprot:m.129227 g.129227  ORF g.129227 m.129227 type:complete len:1009 (+) comp9427_c0_seq1:1767-4793(+)
MALLQTLQACLANAMAFDLAVRRAAEEEVARLGLSPEFSTAAATLMAEGSVDLAVRQLAGVVLKQHVDVHWAPENEERFQPPEVPHEAKQATKAILLSALVDPNSKIRSMAAYTTSIIAQHEWPGRWPELFDQLLAALFSGNPHAVHGSLRVLTEFVEFISEEQIERVLPLLFPKLAQIALDQTKDMRTRGRAIDIFSSLAETVATIGMHDERLLREFLAPQLAEWLQLLGGVLGAAGSDYGLRTSSVRACTALVRAIPKKCSKHIAAVLGPLWGLLVAGAEAYSKDILSGEDNLENQVDEDGEVLSFESMMLNVFELISAICEQNSLRKAIRGHLPQLVELVITYMPMTDDQIELWANDPNQYVEDEAEETFSCSLRVVAEGLLRSLLDEYELEAASALAGAIGRRVAIAFATRASGAANWWKLLEATLMAFVLAAESIVEGIESHTIAFDLAAFTTIVIESCASPDIYLQAGAFLCGGAISKAIPPASKGAYVQAATAAIRPGVPVCVQVGAMRGLSQFCEALDAAEVGGLLPFMPALFEGLTAVALNSPQEVVRVAMETLNSLVAVAPEAATAAEKSILPLAIAVFVKMFNDHVMVEIIVDLFDTLCRTPALVPHVVRRMLPTIVSVVQQHANPALMGLAAAGVDVLTVIVKHAPPPLEEAVIRDGFVTVARAVMASQDASLLQNGGECMRVFVDRHAAQLLDWSDGAATGLQYVAQLVSFLLHPDQSDSAAVFVGKLVRVVISKAGARLGEHLKTLLVSVLNRLQLAKTSMIIQSLVLVFAQLLHSSLDEVVLFLQETQSVEFLLGSWFEHYESFFGNLDCKLSAIGLARLLAQRRELLDAVIVKGDEVATEGIRTRSRAKAKEAQFQMIPASVKALKLLISEFGTILENERNRPAGDEEEEGDDDDEDGDWEDDEPTRLKSKSPFVEAIMLSDLIDLGAAFGQDDDDLDDENEDDKSDPLYAFDLKGALTELFRALAADQAFSGRAMALLTPAEQHTLMEAFK